VALSGFVLGLGEGGLVLRLLLCLLFQGRFGCADLGGRPSRRANSAGSSSPRLPLPYSASSKYSGSDKRRYYLSALGPTTECAAIFDILHRLKLVAAEAYRATKQMLDRVAAMLVKLAKRHEQA